MSGQWKPGDVGVTEDGTVGLVVSIETSHGCPPAAGHPTEPHWHFVTGTYSPLAWEGVRPLVVIDPEDTEAVERLLDAYDGKSGGWDKGEYIARLQAALREFARPTPPKCPATLVIGGERLECERDPGHVTDHRNDSIGQGVRWSA